ncbi:MAG: hypothetical protein JW908_15810 [Anaerolineales bacterium]|nr:hypothetical protein [Anaerolineales bacterium]
MTKKQGIVLLIMSFISVCLITGGAWWVFQTYSLSNALSVTTDSKAAQITVVNPGLESNLPNNTSIPETSTPFMAAKPTDYPTFTATPTYLIQTGIAPSSTPIPSSTAAPSLTPAPAYQQPTVIGYSVLGRELHIYTFGSGIDERMIIAGIHGGNEYNTIQLANQLISYLNDHPQKIPAGVKLYILPCLNPDGAARSHDMYGRANAHNVDLNHNWPAYWKADWDRSGCWRYLHLNGGNTPASEPETQALMSFLISHHIKALISYHSAALGIFPGGIPPTDKSLSLAAAVADVSDYPYPSIETGCDMSGALVDWASAQGIAALDIELTDHTHTDYQQNLRILEVLLNWQP